MTPSKLHCRVCDMVANVRNLPGEEDALLIDGCACGGPFKVRGGFWAVASYLRREEPVAFRHLSGYIRHASAEGTVPCITLDNWRTLAADLG
jgi:hypothetical protein